MTGALKRRLGFGLLTLYGVGVMVGAGIYVLVGAVAEGAGAWAPVAFLLAGLVALPSALSFAELSARMPEAAGEVAFVEAGLGLRWLAVVVGLAVVAAGIVSAAAVLRGGVGYLVALVPVAPPLAAVLLGGALTVVATVGVLESLGFAAVLTLIETAGLGLVIWAGMQAPAVEAVAGAPALGGLVAAAALAFFAFIGFEDMVNMAEEVRDPTRVMPRAIVSALVATSVLYALVSWAAVRAVPVERLAASERPLALVWEAGSGQGPAVLSAIAVAAALNGVLAQIVMAARILYGLGRREAWLAPFARVGARSGTPVTATLVVGAVVIAAALVLPVGQLAGAASMILLGVFVVVNLALILLKRSRPEAPFRVPGFVPWAGLGGSAVALVASISGP